MDPLEKHPHSRGRLSRVANHERNRPVISLVAIKHTTTSQAVVFQPTIYRQQRSRTLSTHNMSRLIALSERVPFFARTNLNMSSPVNSALVANPEPICR